MAGSWAPYIPVILSYIVSITWYITQPLVSDTTAHYQSAVSMISFAQTWTAQWSDTIPSWNVQLIVRIHLTWFCFNKYDIRYCAYGLPSIAILSSLLYQLCSELMMTWIVVQIGPITWYESIYGILGCQWQLGNGPWGSYSAHWLLTQSCLKTLPTVLHDPIGSRWWPCSACALLE